MLEQTGNSNTNRAEVKMMMVLLLLHENDVYVCHKKVKWHIMHIQEVYVIMIDGYIFLNKQWDRYWQSI
jgi:acyl-coenzyme A synthetase/AMP-(fatty) acid ligase